MTEPKQKPEPQPVSRFKHAVTGGALWFSALALAAGTTVCRAETTLESAFQSPPRRVRQRGGIGSAAGSRRPASPTISPP